MMLKPGDLDWAAIARAGDAGAGIPRMEPVPACRPARRRWRPGKVSIVLLAAWLLWEAAGVARALTIGPPILEAIWSARP